MIRVRVRSMVGNLGLITSMVGAEVGGSSLGLRLGLTLR